MVKETVQALAQLNGDYDARMVLARFIADATVGPVEPGSGGGSATVTVAQIYALLDNAIEGERVMTFRVPEDRAAHDDCLINCPESRQSQNLGGRPARLTQTRVPFNSRFFEDTLPMVNGYD